MKVGRSSRKYYLDVTFASFLSIQHFVGDLSVCKLPYFPQSHRLFVKYSCNDPFIVCQISQKDSEGLQGEINTHCDPEHFIWVILLRTVILRIALQ
jgi:hypothetical protein